MLSPQERPSGLSSWGPVGILFPRLPGEGRHTMWITTGMQTSKRRAGSAVSVDTHPPKFLLKWTAAWGPRTKHPGKGGESKRVSSLVKRRPSHYCCTCTSRCTGHLCLPQHSEEREHGSAVHWLSPELTLFPRGRQLTWIMKPFSSSISQMHRTISLRASSSSWDSSKLVESKSWLYSSPLSSKLSVEESSRNSTSVKSGHTERDPQHRLPCPWDGIMLLHTEQARAGRCFFSHTDVFLSFPSAL